MQQEEWVNLFYLLRKASGDSRIAGGDRQAANTAFNLLFMALADANVMTPLSLVEELTKKAEANVKEG